MQAKDTNGNNIDVSYRKLKKNNDVKSSDSKSNDNDDGS